MAKSAMRAHAMIVAPRILIVDDFQDARELYEEYLRLRGFDVTGAPDGPAALLLALPKPYDIIVLDLALPRMDGMDVLRRLRADPKTAETPIIILSASVDSEARHDTLRAGADLFLEKPCLPDELEAAVVALLARKRRAAP